MALARSPEVGESVGETAAARSDLSKVLAGAYYPQLEVTAITGPVNDAREPVIRGNRIHDPSPGTSLASTGIFGRLDFTLTQPLYTFGKLSNREQAARLGVKATELETEKKKDAVALRVKQLYYALVLAGQGVEAADEAGTSSRMPESAFRSSWTWAPPTSLKATSTGSMPTRPTPFAPGPKRKRGERWLISP